MPSPRIRSAALGAALAVAAAAGWVGVRELSVSRSPEQDSRPADTQVVAAAPAATSEPVAVSEPPDEPVQGDPQLASSFVPLPPATVTPPPASAIDAAAPDPSAELETFVNLPDTTVRPPSGSTLLSVSLTAAYPQGAAATFSWNYSASAPLVDAAARAGFPDSIDQSRWRQRSANIGSVQVGPDSLDGTAYVYAAVHRADGDLTMNVLERSDGSTLLQVAHRNLVYGDSVTPVETAAPLRWINSLPQAPSSRVESLHFYVERDQAAMDPATGDWVGMLSVSMRTDVTDRAGVVAALARSAPVGFVLDGIVEAGSSSRVLYVDSAGNRATAEIYADGAALAVDWHVNLRASGT
jgi:hypothetical protein